MEQSAESIWLFDPDTKQILEANTAFCEMLGYAAEELLGMTNYDFVAHDREDVDSSIRRVMQERRGFFGERKYRRKDGTLLDVSVSGTVIPYRGREVMCGVARDLTERKQAEEALRESEERFRTAFEDAPIGVALVGLDGRRFRVNRTLCEMLSYSEEELLGKAYLEHIHPDDREVSTDHFRRVLEEGVGSYVLERRYIRADGGVVWNLTSVSLIRDSKSEPSHFVCLHQDISERKRAEEEMKEANRRLKELAVLKADFTAMVAHEIDTPLAVISGYADLVAEDELEPAERSRVLAKIQDEIDVLKTLVEDVRAAAAVEREDFTIESRQVPVEALLEDATQFAATLPGDHPILTENTADDERVWADPHRIGQALRNLLSNAAKYSPEGEPIELRAKPGEHPGRVRIEVVDRGPGVHPEDVSRVFEKFGRGRDRTGRKVGGVGLGLYLSRRIVRAHGGDLKLEPAPEGGSAFCFELEAVGR